MMRLNDLFEVRYGVNLEFNTLTPDPQGVNFVSRTARNNGVSGKVARILSIEPLPAGTITVAGGGSVMESFLQPAPYYSGRDLYYLTPKVAMTDAQKLYYCACLRANRYRYNYGRQANRTLKDIRIPELKDLPPFVAVANPLEFDGKDAPAGALLQSGVNPFPARMVLVPLRHLFDIRPGNSLEFNRLQVASPESGVPFISRRAGNNGVAAYVEPIPGVPPNPAGEMTVALSGQGGRLSTFVQERPYYTGFHVACLRPRQPMSREIMLYYCACIYANRFRFGFGRQANRTLADITVPMPKKPADWKAVEQYIQGLPFSSQI
ncbi:restriction endonuclease subunit S [Myxococcus virescens]|uniref:restriction endonuclease subunit S n=1 Tax=Myxococcus virescens TaxID=83456 RepID=UPI003DA6A60A